MLAVLAPPSTFAPPYQAGTFAYFTLTHSLVLRMPIRQAKQAWHSGPPGRPSEGFYRDSNTYMVALCCSIGEWSWELRNLRLKIFFPYWRCTDDRVDLRSRAALSVYCQWIDCLHLWDLAAGQGIDHAVLSFLFPLACDSSHSCHRCETSSSLHSQLNR